MTISSILSRIVPFLITLAFGVAIGTFRGGDDVPSARTLGSGSGISYPNPNSAKARTGTNSVRIISKPRATYTEEARQNEVEGVVRLKVTLLASGEVGSIKVEKELPDGLTERAMAAARQLKFQPATVDSVPVSRILTFEYSFSIY